MLPVEGVQPDLCQVDVVEAANVDAELVGVGSRHIEGVNAAMAAEFVLGGQRVELVGGELVLAAQQLEMFRRDDEMQKTLLGADRAVALGDMRQVGGDAKSNPPAMAAAFERSHALHPFHDVRVPARR
jgi:hypothetical protein